MEELGSLFKDSVKSDSNEGRVANCLCLCACEEKNNNKGVLCKKER